MTPPQKRRRSRGTGSIIVQGDSYYGKFRINDRQVKRRLGPVRKPGTRDGLTKTQAEAALRTMIMTATSTVPVAQRVTVGQAGEHLLTHLDLMGRKASTLRGYRSKLRAHIEPKLGSKTINALTVADVDEFVASCITAGLAPKTVRHLVALLGLICAHAMRRGWTNQNPTINVELPRSRPESDRLRFLDADEVQTLINALPDTPRGRMYRGLYLTAVMTGMRLGELAALRWLDIDWNAQRIRVTRNLVDGIYGTPKSGHGRSVPMADQLGGELDRLHRAALYAGDDATIFCNPETGAPMHPRSIHRAFIRDLDAAGVRRITFHELRHTFGTRVAAAGVPMRTLQEWLGHADLATTAIYAHYAPSGTDVALVNAVFSQRSGPTLVPGGEALPNGDHDHHQTHPDDDQRDHPGGSDKLSTASPSASADTFAQ